MRALIQRVRNARVEIDGRVEGEIGAGMLILFAAAVGDKAEYAEKLARKCFGLRIFEDEAKKMNRSLGEIGGAALVVSQFTLYADTSGSGRRPSFSGAAAPELARPCYERFVAALKTYGVPVQTGRFGADMQVFLVNDGPVTLSLDYPSGRSFLQEKTEK
ncbi:MAG: D-aminoacyl-tRNA deacylase [Victivallaceae bacterium]|nr:D-aminoacyl-tRNA deacylase [Victivallaceae bacterium]